MSQRTVYRLYQSVLGYFKEAVDQNRRYKLSELFEEAIQDYRDERCVKDSISEFTIIAIRCSNVTLRSQPNLFFALTGSPLSS